MTIHKISAGLIRILVGKELSNFKAGVIDKVVENYTELLTHNPPIDTIYLTKSYQPIAYPLKRTGLYKKTATGWARLGAMNNIIVEQSQVKDLSTKITTLEKLSWFDYMYKKVKSEDVSDTDVGDIKTIVKKITMQDDTEFYRVDKKNISTSKTISSKIYSDSALNVEVASRY